MSEELDLGSDDRPFRYVEVGADGHETVVYRASAVGGCERALVATARKLVRKPHPAWFQEVLDEGKRMEPVIDQAWQEKSDTITVNRQKTLELEIGEIDERRVIVRAHIDGEAAFTGDLREYKKFRDSTWDKFLRSGVEVNVNYPWQVAAMMHAGRYDVCEFVGGHYDADKDKIVDTFCHELRTPPIPLLAIKKKIARVERLINSGMDPTDDGVTCTGAYPCPYWYLPGHGKTEDAVAEAVVVALSDALADAIADWHAAKQQAAKARGELKAHEGQTKLAAEKIKTMLKGDGVTAGTQAQAGDWTIDWKLVERKGYEVKPTTYETIDINIKEEGK